ncbi:MAG: hypothetical protein M1838_004956 [Thelocarpon superellum]|nr:MAG: hypothetical protein M1838_004956 [Thelocarpon superellum]
MRSSIILAGSVLLGVCVAISWPPEPTNADAVKLTAHQGFTPRPTNGPSLNKVSLELAKNKHKRDVVGTNVCGFVDGDSSEAISCSIDRTCLFYHFPASLSLYGMAGCCQGTNTIDCGWAVDCVNSADYDASCDLDCQTDTLTRKCTDADEPYCSSYKYPESDVLDYGCGALPSSGYQEVLLTYSGENSPSNSINVLSDLFSTTPTDSSRPTLPTRTSSSSQTNSPLPSPQTGSSVPVGAIAGGVVGGLLLIGGIIAVALFLCLRSRRAARRGRAGPGGPAVGPQAGTQYAPGQAPGGYYPVQQQAPPMQQQGPPQPPPPGPSQGPMSPMSPMTPMAGAGAAGFYPPDQKQMEPTIVEPEANTYQGVGGVSPQPSYRPFSSEMEGSSTTPSSPLPSYNQASYVPPQSTGASEVSHLDSHSTGPPLTSYNGGPIYEAPGQ